MNRVDDLAAAAPTAKLACRLRGPHLGTCCAAGAAGSDGYAPAAGQTRHACPNKSQPGNGHSSARSSHRGERERASAWRRRHWVDRAAREQSIGGGGHRLAIAARCHRPASSQYGLIKQPPTNESAVSQRRETVVPRQPASQGERGRSWIAASQRPVSSRRMASAEATSPPAVGGGVWAVWCS